MSSDTTEAPDLAFPVDRKRKNELRQATATVVAAYVGNVPVDADKVTDIIRSVHKTFLELDGGEIVSAAAAVVSTPATDPKNSVHDDYIICLEDGKSFKSLKRHLREHFGMSPDQYREKWGLAASYPMVARNFSKQRSALAKVAGFGRRAK